MSRRSGELAAAGRLAILGAETAVGARLREVLAEARVPGGRVELFATSPSQEAGGLLSEYAGEARLIQQARLESLEGHAVVFVCARTPESERLAAGASEATLWLDLDPLASAAPGALAPSAADAQALRSGPRRLCVAHTLSLMLRELLEPVQRAVGLEEVTGVVLRPAADYGARALEELREQTLRLFRFEPYPTEVFGKALSFNVLPETCGIVPADTGRRIAQELEVFLGWSEPRLSVTLLAVPVFHGHAAALHLRCPGRASVRDVERVLRDCGLDRPEGRTPMEAAERETGLHAEVRPSETGGVWVWAVHGAAEGARLRLAWRLAQAWMGGS